VGKHEGERPPGRPRHGGLDNIKMHFKEIEWYCVDWIVWLRTGTNREHCN